MKYFMKIIFYISLMMMVSVQLFAQETGYEMAVAGKVVWIDTEQLYFNIIDNEKQIVPFVLTKNSKIAYAKSIVLRQPTIHNLYIGGVVHVVFLPGVRQHTVLSLTIY